MARPPSIKKVAYGLAGREKERWLMERYELTGGIEWCLAGGDLALREEIDRFMDRLVKEDGSLTQSLWPEDLPALIYWQRETKAPKYERAVRRMGAGMEPTIPAMAFYAAYDTAYNNKEHYSDIVKHFYDLQDLTPDDLVILTDTIGQMSEEIYEHYRALIDLLRRHLRKAMAETWAQEETVKLAYSALKAFRLGFLEQETYGEFGRKIWKSTAGGGNDRGDGMYHKFRGQHLLLGK